MLNSRSVIYSKAPLRLGLAGGGTDVPQFYKNNGNGCVINVSLNLYSYCTIIFHKSGEDIEFVSLDSNSIFKCQKTNYINPVGELVIHKAVFNRIVKDYLGGKSIGGITVVTRLDVVSSSGLGGSSSTVVAILNAYSVLFDLFLTPKELAELAYVIEREDLNMEGGKQDQYCAAFGGINIMDFYSDDHVSVTPLNVPEWFMWEIELSLILYFTGINRNSSTIISQQSTNISKNVNNALKYMEIIKQETLTMKEGLLSCRMDLIKKSIINSWNAKKATANTISNPDIDSLFAESLNNGAYAGKISGAGGGGFMMLLCDPIKRHSIITKLQSIKGYVINSTFTTNGAKAWKGVEL